MQQRDEVSLQPILRWLNRHIQNPRYRDVCVDVAMAILELYSGQMGQSVAIDGQISLLHARVRKEVGHAQQACQTGGMLTLLVAGR